MIFKILALSVILALALSADPNATISCTQSNGTKFTEAFTCYPNGWGVKTSTETWLKVGAPKSKLAAGLAFYSHTFGKTEDTQLQSGIWDTCSWCYSIPAAPAEINYFGIKSALLEKGQEMNGYKYDVCRDDVQQSPWAYTPDPCVNGGCDNNKTLSNAPSVNFISYDDPESMRAKTQWAIDEGLGSLIIWELYGDDCASSLLNAIHETKIAAKSDIKVTAYYGNWRIYDGNKYYPYLPKSKESSFTCSDKWEYSKPAIGNRNWGITDDIASKIDILNVGFATISYDSHRDVYFAVSPDPNADYMDDSLPSGSGCTTMLKNPMCLSPFIGAYTSSECSGTPTNSQGFVTYAQCSVTQNTKSGLTCKAETYDTSDKKLAGVYNAVCELKKANPSVRAGISVGGWFDSSYFSAAADEKYRLTTAKGIARYVDAFGFDNLDIDWEYPTSEHCNEDVPAASQPSWAKNLPVPEGCKSSGSDGYNPNNSDNIIDCYKEGTTCQYPRRVYDPINVVLFLRDTKRELAKLDETYELTMALRADPNWVMERMPGELMEPYLDQFNDMTYDYNAAYNGYAALNSPLGSCANPGQWEKMEDVDCVTSEFGALDSNGVFKVGATSECLGLCDGSNWGEKSDSGLQMQYKTIVTSPKKHGKQCGKLYNISQCSGTCSLTNPNYPDHYAEWKNGTSPIDPVDPAVGTWVVDWDIYPCGCKNKISWEGQVTYPNVTSCCANICSSNSTYCEEHSPKFFY